MCIRDRSYIDTIKEKARSDRKTIVMPETNDKRTLIAAAHVLQEGIANIIMVGNEEKIMDGAGWLEVDLTGVTAVSYTHLDVYKRQVQHCKRQQRKLHLCGNGYDARSGGCWNKQKADGGRAEEPWHLPR